MLQLLLRIGAGRFDPDPSNTVQRVSGSSLPELQGIEVSQLACRSACGKLTYLPDCQFGGLC